jgi:hypothetical protein
MDERKYYLCKLLLDCRPLYVIWYSDAVDGLVRLKDRKIASFADERQVRAFCRENGISLMLEPPAVYDFDKVATWCGCPAAGSIEPTAFLNAWNMFEDAHGFRLDAHLHDVSSQRAGKIYDKLFFANNLPAVTPHGASYEPIWSEDEVELLSRIYHFGLAELCASIQDISH